jgi:hypothetical protein
MHVKPGRWLLDACLPRRGYAGMDAVHARDFPELADGAALGEATRLNRNLVTCRQAFQEPWTIASDQAGVVIFEEAPVSATEIERNLGHLEFRIGQYEGSLQLAGNRFVIRADREVSVLGSAGQEIPLEPWLDVHMKQGGSSGTAALAV